MVMLNHVCIHETKKPSVCRSPRAVKDGVAQSFDVLVLAAIWQGSDAADAAHSAKW
jgi:hypothetical protein